MSNNWQFSIKYVTLLDFLKITNKLERRLKSN